YIGYIQLITTATAFLFTLATLYTIYNTKKNCQLLERNARTIYTKLEKVIRITSQIQDHSPPDRFVVRLELELRLADAESALEYYKIVDTKDYLPHILTKSRWARDFFNKN
ncbi:MAG: hypothetical protein AAGA60_10030, partial [Cyanobacteria bacterium P01_E01_bin.42]